VINADLGTRRDWRRRCGATGGSWARPLACRDRPV